MAKIATIPADEYFADLDRRLKEYGFTHADLARVMEISPVQLSRLFTKKNQNPLWATMLNAEQSFETLRRRAAASK